MVAVPAPTAETSPLPSTVATAPSSDAHVKFTPGTGCPVASSASADRRSVSPSACSVSAAGRTLDSTARCSTVTSAVPASDPASAMTVAVPAPAAVTSPLPSTVATASSVVDQDNSRPGAGWPFASSASADKRIVSPTAVSVAVAGDTRTSTGRCSTVTSAVAASDPAEARMVAVPAPTAVTSPLPSTVATASSVVDQDNSRPGAGWPFASSASADKRIVSPTAVSVPVAGDTRTSTGRCSTVTSAVAASDPAEARMVAVPAPAAVTSPLPSTEATASSVVDQDNSRPGAGWPFASSASADKRIVSPTAVSVAVAGDTRTSTGRCSTVTSAVAASDPAEARMVAVPAPAAVTSPLPSTVATASSVVDQDNSRPGAGWPFASSASADKRIVSPTAVSVAVAGDTRTSTGRCSTVTSAVPVTAPAAAPMVAVPSPTEVASPVPSTLATDSSEVDQVSPTPVMVRPF